MPGPNFNPNRASFSGTGFYRNFGYAPSVFSRIGAGMGAIGRGLGSAGRTAGSALGGIFSRMRAPATRIRFEEPILESNSALNKLGFALKKGKDLGAEAAAYTKDKYPIARSWINRAAMRHPLLFAAGAATTAGIGFGLLRGDITGGISGGFVGGALGAGIGAGVGYGIARYRLAGKLTKAAIAGGAPAEKAASEAVRMAKASMAGEGAGKLAAARGAMIGMYSGMLMGAFLGSNEPVNRINGLYR